LKTFSKLEITYMAQPPKRYTFEMPLLKKWVENHCQGKVLNLFAGRVKLDVDETRVDIDKNMPADFYMDAEEFIKHCILKEIKFDTIILDPPYSMRKSREKYEGRYIGSFTKIKNLIPQILKPLKPYSRVITLGYSSTGMSASRGFRKVALCIICHKGDHDDTFVTVEDACGVTVEKDLIAVVEVING